MISKNMSCWWTLNSITTKLSRYLSGLSRKSDIDRASHTLGQVTRYATAMYETALQGEQSAHFELSFVQIYFSSLVSQVGYICAGTMRVLLYIAISMSVRMHSLWKLTMPMLSTLSTEAMMTRLSPLSNSHRIWRRSFLPPDFLFGVSDLRYRWH